MTWRMYFSLFLVAAGDASIAFAYCTVTIGGNCVGVGLHLWFSWKEMTKPD